MTTPYWVIIPFIRKVLPRLIAEDIIGVQSMTGNLMTIEREGTTQIAVWYPQHGFVTKMTAWLMQTDIKCEMDDQKDLLLLTFESEANATLFYLAFQGASPNYIMGMRK